MHRAELRCRQHRLDQSVAVLREPQDPVPVADTDGRQGVGQPVGALVELAVAVAVLAADVRERRVWAACSREHVGHRHLVEEVGARSFAPVTRSRLYDPDRLVAGAGEGLAVEDLDAVSIPRAS